MKGKPFFAPFAANRGSETALGGTGAHHSSRIIRSVMALIGVIARAQLVFEQVFEKR